MNQVLRMQNQLMQGFLVSENRLKEKQQELSQEVETQVTVAKKKLAQKQEQATSRKENQIVSIRSRSEKTLTNLKGYQYHLKSYCVHEARLFHAIQILQIQSVQKDNVPITDVHVIYAVQKHDHVL